VESHSKHLQRLYDERFAGQHAYRNQVWRVLTARFFSKWIAQTDIVLDLGCGYGEFINNVQAAKKYAMDLNPDSVNHAADDVELILHDCSTAWPVPASSLDVVFTSNFLEHLFDKQQVMNTLRNAFESLRPGGRIVAIGPNIKHLPGEYWDFFDHLVPLTELSLSEALVAAGFQIEECCGRFLPYTMSEGRKYPPVFVRLYIRFRLAWRLLGKQFLVVATKP
jgi:SAM-dependent methyltransferase